MAPRRRTGRRRLPLPFSPFGRTLSLTRKPKPRTKPRGPRARTDPQAIRRTRRSSSPSAPSSSSSEGDDQEEAVEMLQADFGFFDPKPGDFGGVKLLLQGYLGTHPWDLSGFVDLILAQTTVGTVVKSEGGDDDDDSDDDEGIYAIISALNLARYAAHRCIIDLKEFVLGVCDDEGLKKKMESLFGEQARDASLLVSQRFVNCPHQLVPPLYDALFDEVSWATEDEPTEELRNFFQFKYYLLIARIYKNNSVKKHKVRTSRNLDEPIIYMKAEDEIFHELSTFSFTFNVQSDCLAPQELRNYKEMGLVMVLEGKEVPRFRVKLKSLLVES